MHRAPCIAGRARNAPKAHGQAEQNRRRQGNREVSRRDVERDATSTKETENLAPERPSTKSDHSRNCTYLRKTRAPKTSRGLFISGAERTRNKSANGDRNANVD